MLRVSVLSVDGKPLMPTKASRARRWLKQRIAKVIHNDLNIFQIQLMQSPETSHTQSIVVGIDPGKLYTGIGVQSAKFTLWLAHLQLPFNTVRKRMDQRRIMRRGRRSRRINRKVVFTKRAHRQKRFDNRCHGSRIPPSIRAKSAGQSTLSGELCANRELELRVLGEISDIYPITVIVYEIIKANGDKSFSPVMVGQKWQLGNLRNDWGDENVFVIEGWKTSQIRTQLGLEKQKHSKGDTVPATHAVDGVALACSQFIDYGIVSRQLMGWRGSVNVTSAPFAVISRPPVSRRQLHLMVPAKGGVRRKYGGTVTRHGFRKGDYVEAIQAGRVYRGWVSGDTEKRVAVSDANWVRIKQFSAKKVRLLQRSTGLIVTGTKVPVHVSSVV
ncbi:MAG: RRXRR domain-containing protein [Rhizonema sp. NSF051]|nr:RRXRR domain-containing protein [Rhizonema sp. NSF051]